MNTLHANRFLACLLVGAAVAAAAEVPVSMEMHVHGSLSEGKGTMWGETARAEEIGLDVLWWSDHDNRIAYWRMDGAGRFGWEEGLTQTAPDSGTELTWVADTHEMEDQVAEATDATAYEGSRSFRLAGRAPEGSDWKALAFRYQTGRGYHHRSLLSDIWVRIAVRPPANLYSNKKVAVALRLELSVNLEDDAMTLTYVAGIKKPKSTKWHAWRNLPAMTPGEWNLLEIPITQHAVESFPFGDDNSFRRFMVAVVARRGASVEAFFDDFAIEVRGVRGQALLERQREVITSRYAQVVGQLAGTEITPAGHHLNAFGTSVPLIDYDDFDHDRYPRSAVEHVHAHGGVVSYNHIFGAGGDRGLTEEQARQLIKKKAKKLVAERAYGVDVLEVGYQHRGLPIEGHLAIWDALSADGVFVTGNGVTDDHHATVWEKLTNNMVTWLWVESPTEADFLQALRAGRAFFGDPLLVGRDAAIDLTTPEGYRMGQVIATERATHDVRVTVEEIQKGYKVKWVVGGVTKKTWTSPGPRFEMTKAVDTTADTFVRVEVWTGDGRPVLFSNPIYFLHAPPPGAVPPARKPPAPQPVGGRNRLPAEDGLPWEGGPKQP